ncbi:MAG TPA: hypothetical protein PLR35_15510 [Burkholderiaceae bacterium]|nr:hypothetical protein [Burkholderiaceae bacterium]
MPFVFDWRGFTDDALRTVLDQLRGAPGAPTASAEVSVPPAAGTSGLDALLPSRVDGFVRISLNDRFGGLDQGGVHAAYDADGHPVRALVRRAASPAAAEVMVAGAPRGAGHAAWSEGRLWFYVSGGTVEGDDDPSFDPGDVEATERFVAAFRAQRKGAD